MRRQPEALDGLIEGYLEYLAEVSRKQPRTVIDVRCTLGRISRSLSVLRPGVPLWRLTLEDYIQWLQQERQQGRSESCLAKYLSHLRGLLEYAWRSGRSERNVLDGFQLVSHHQRQVPAALTVDEARRLVQGCPRSTPQERRERVAILLLYGCGLRTQELCALNVEDINGQRGELLVRHGKGDRERLIPVPQGVLTEVLALMLERGGRRGPLLRTQAKGRRWSSKEVCRVISLAAARAGLSQQVTPKVLRHSYATHLMDAGVDLAVISSLMGHRSVAETGVYLHVLEDRPRQAVAQLSRRSSAMAEGGRG